MFIYNITTKVEKSKSENWRKWQLEEHIPDIMGTELFSDFKFYQLLGEDESEGLTFVLQLYFIKMDNYELYLKAFATPLREKAIHKWGNNFIAHRTIMQAVQ